MSDPIPIELREKLRSKWRHTFAPSLRRRDGNMEILKLIFGQKRSKTTQKYLHPNKKDLIRKQKNSRQNNLLSNHKIEMAKTQA
jgi:hypothetical protein